MSIDFLGFRLKSPLILSSGPAARDSSLLIRAAEAGAGAVVTPTIRLKPMVNPIPNLAAVCGGTSMLNSQGHSDVSWEDWVKVHVPKVKASGAVVVAKIGYSIEEVSALAPVVTDAGADILEIIAPTSELMPEMVRAAKSRTKDKSRTKETVPVVAKISGRWADRLGVAARCVAAGADGLTAMDTVGPALAIDVRTGKPRLGGRTAAGRGFGWLSGRAIHSLAVATVAQLALSHSVPIVGVGGVASAEDALEMIMAGATAVGIQTAAALRGPGVFSEIIEGLNTLLSELGYKSVNEARGVALPYIRGAEEETIYTRRGVVLRPECCSTCYIAGACPVNCPYGLLTFESGGVKATETHGVDPKEYSVDLKDCSSCGLCASLCIGGGVAFEDPH